MPKFKVFWCLSCVEQVKMISSSSEWRILTKIYPLSKLIHIYYDPHLFMKRKFILKLCHADLSFIIYIFHDFQYKKNSILQEFKIVTVN